MASALDRRSSSDTMAPRQLGRYRVGRPGPLFVAIGSLHGNEPAGVDAIEAVLRELDRTAAPLNGEFVGLTGNREARARGQRFVQRDLNRRWEEPLLAALHARPPGLDVAEDVEQRELFDVFRELERETEGPLVVLDLHSTSSEGASFACMADVLRNRKIAFSLPVPVILGLEEAIDGSMLGYLNDRGHVTVAFEGGQHQNPETVLNHTAAIWMALVAAGCLTPEHVPDHDAHRARLVREGRGLPEVVEIRYRHVVAESDDFRMQPGYTNFQPIRAGELLAHDRDGGIKADQDGRILMPLYQAQGEDGYFICRDVRPFWLRLSAMLRRLGADRLIPFLPGVQPHPTRPDRFRVNPRVARYLVTDIFHLFGYRRRQPEHGALVFSRRLPDRTLRLNGVDGQRPD